MKKRTLSAILASLGLAMMTAAGGAQVRYEGNLMPEVRTSQDDINNGAIGFSDIFYRGFHIYSNRYTRVDGYGEAPDGPRRSMFQLNQNEYLPYLRLSGLDAQACFECHAQMGFNHYNGMRLPKEPGVVGSSAGLSANIFLFPNFGDLTEGIIRNPPHNFGLGYVQRLAEEMSFELMEQRDEAIAQAQAEMQDVQVLLSAKGVPFGSLTAMADGSVDLSGLDGVSEDLVVRPFQFKGIASTLRNFITNALNFHFSMQPKETLERGIIPNDNPNGTLEGDIDFEILEGEVTAIAGFLAANRPPMQDSTGLDAALVTRGRELLESTGCTTCHVPSLKIWDSRVTIIDPRMVTRMQRERERNDPEFISLRSGEPAPQLTLTVPDWTSDFLPTSIQYQWMKNREQFASVVGDERALVGDRPPGLTVDLNADFLPEEALPRLPYNTDGSIDVPLFTDLKRHDMGEHLMDHFAEPTDTMGIEVPARLFMTRPLWGVADSPPYLHDGRATTLHEAILMHEGPGSEANPVIASFRALDIEDQYAIVEFLYSLRNRPMMRGPEPNRIDRQGWVVR